MKKFSFFLDDLISRATKKGNDDLVKKLSNDTFVDSLKTLFNAFDDIDLEIVPKESSSFDQQKEINLKISRALADNYFTMYYINLDTDKYLSYTSCNDYRSLSMIDDGNDFFAKAHKNALKVVYEPDVERIITFLNKKDLYEKTEDGNSASITYRLIMNDKPTYVQLKALRLANDNHLIIGISNIDEQKKAELEYKKEMEKNLTYYNIALSLVKNYFTIYYVNVNTSAYIEYTIDSENQALKKVATGTDFFEECKVNARKFLVYEDQKKFLDSLDRDNLLQEINSGIPFKITYKQIINDVPTFVQLTAINLVNDNNHVLLAVSNIDAQRKRDLEYAKNLELEKALARIDALTGAKNKYCYIETEKFVNEKIANKTMPDFSVLICDINDLKVINDTFGHDAGDKIIKDAKNLLSSIFQNSSVFRIGGDEFALILEGSDYYKRDNLAKKINESNFKNMGTYNLVLANGYSDYNSETDNSVLDVFRRADEIMYNNKKMLKGKRS